MRNEIAFICGCLGALCVGLLPGRVGAKPVVVDRIVAVIAGDIVTLRELDARAEPYMEHLAGVEDAQIRAGRRLAILRQVLDIQIGEKIVDQKIATSHEMLGVTESDVDDAIAQVRRMNSLSEEQLRTALIGQGLGWSEYRTKLRTQIERSRLIQMKVQGKVQVTREDAQRLCAKRQARGDQEVKVCASHVLFKVDAGMSNEQINKRRNKASRVQAELAAGGDFAAYAMKYSDDKGSPDGSLGCFGPGEMMKEFEDVAFAMATGDVSPVVRTTYGFHVIRVTGHQAPPVANCDTDEALAPFRNEVYQQEMERAMGLWIEELRQESFVEVRL